MYDLLEEFWEYIQAATRCLPGRSGMILRSSLIRWALNKCGFGFRIEIGPMIKGYKNIQLGDNVSLGTYNSLYAHSGGRLIIGDRLSTNHNVMISASENGHITIGDNVIIGPNTAIRASNHRYERNDIPIRDQGHKPGEIVIEDDVWIAANVVVVAGAHIGRGCVIAAGSVVNAEIPAYSVAGGIPARIIRNRKTIKED